MDIKELDKKQLVLLTLLITFVVSIATGIVTVSLMNQAPKSVPQTINNVIQRTIEKVTTVEVPASVNEDAKSDGSDNNSPSPSIGGGDALVSIYLQNTEIKTPSDVIQEEIGQNDDNNSDVVGQGVIVSDIGLILVDSNLIKDGESYKVILNDLEFSVSVLKRFSNGFTILKISPIEEKIEVPTTSQNSQ